MTPADVVCKGKSQPSIVQYAEGNSIVTLCECRFVALPAECASVSGCECAQACLMGGRCCDFVPFSTFIRKNCIISRFLCRAEAHRHLGMKV